VALFERLSANRARHVFEIALFICPVDTSARAITRAVKVVIVFFATNVAVALSRFSHFPAVLAKLFVKLNAFGDLCQALAKGLMRAACSLRCSTKSEA
jgi:hypothetical protein